MTVQLIRELPVNSKGFVTRLAFCEYNDVLRLRSAHIVHKSPGGDAEIPILRNEEGYMVWLPEGFIAKGEAYSNEGLVPFVEGKPEHLTEEAARYWRANGLRLST